MKDEKNYLQAQNAEQTQVQDQGDFYVDPSDPYANSQQTNESEMFPSSSRQEKTFAGGSNVQNAKPIIFGIVVLAAGILGYLFMPEKKTEQQIVQEKKQAIEVKKDETIKTATPVQVVTETPQEKHIDLPKVVESIPITPPKPPQPPVVPQPVLPVIPSFNRDVPTPQIQPPLPSSGSNENRVVSGLLSSDEEEKKRQQELDARRKSAIIVMGGKGGAETPTGTNPNGTGADGKPADGSASSTATKKSSSDFLGFGEGTLNEQVLSKTSSQQVTVTHMGRLDSMVGQGKIIDAVLETAINSDLPGTLRALVSRDVYAESGKAVLIPKGSRVFGTYSVELKPGQSRVGVTWDRLIRPDGIDMQLGSPGTDSLGRAGVAGFLDDKMMTKLGMAFLISYIIPTTINKLSNVNDKGITQTSTTATDGSRTTSTSGGTVASSQLQDSAKQFQDIAKKSLEESLNTKSTVYVDQGAKITIFVNKDIVFPPQVALSSIKMVK